MKVTSIQAVGAGKGNNGAFGGEKKAQRIARMRAYWKQPVNASLIPVGRILSAKASATQSCADVIADKGTIELEAILSTDGKTLPLASGFSMSLANIRTWGCPACHSAHGSGVAPSRDLDAENLATNDFFYRPADKTVITISDTCYRQYVKDLNETARFSVAAPAKASK